MEKELKERLERMVGEGRTEAKFGKLENANLFKNILTKHNISSKIEQRIGHATTIDTHPSILLAKHFHVTGLTTKAHNVLGKFL